MTISGWLFDLLGIRAITDSLGTVFPQRQTLRFLGATVADNSVLGSTDVTIAAVSYHWIAGEAPHAAADRYVPVSNDITAMATTEAVGQYIVTRAFTASYFAFMCGFAALATDTVTATVRKNGVDTALTFVIPAGSAQGVIVADSAHSVTFARGDKVSIKLRQSGAATQAAWNGIFQIG